MMDKTTLSEYQQYSDKYNADEITDVFVIDPTEAPGSVTDCLEWCKSKVVE